MCLIVGPLKTAEIPFGSWDVDSGEPKLPCIGCDIWTPPGECHFMICVWQRCKLSLPLLANYFTVNKWPFHKDFNVCIGCQSISLSDFSRNLTEYQSKILPA